MNKVRSLLKILESNIDLSKVKFKTDDITDVDLFHVSAFYNGKKIGYASFTGKGKNQMMAYQLEVDPKFRGNGIGTMMYHHAEKTIKRKIIPSRSRTVDAVKMWKRFKPEHS